VRLRGLRVRCFRRRKQPLGGSGVMVKTVGQMKQNAIGGPTTGCRDIRNSSK
jgi:hypothetical protein